MPTVEAYEGVDMKLLMITGTRISNLRIRTRDSVFNHRGKVKHNNLNYGTLTMKLRFDNNGCNVVVSISPWKLAMILIASAALSFSAAVTRFRLGRASLQPELPLYFIAHQKSVLQTKRENLNGHTISRNFYETMVHPALFTHTDPRRVLIVVDDRDSSAASDILREVLKHNTVEQVQVLSTHRGDKDDSSVSCQLVAKSLVDCAIEAHVDCQDDAASWFLRRHVWNRATVDGDFDVVFADMSHDDIVHGPMLALSPQALSDNGVLAFQLQSMNTITEFFSPMKDFAAVVTRLEALGFESIVDYSDAHANPDYMKPLSFVIALKNRDNLGNFFMNQAEQSMQISKRTIQKATGESPFVYFDGASMMPYQFTSRIVENLWCSLRNDDYCRKGHGYNPELTNFPISAFSVKESTVANGGRGVFASEFIPKASFIGLEDVANFIYLPSSSFDVLTRTANVVNESISEFWSTVYWGYFEGYGWDFSGWGPNSMGVDTGIMTFVNHGCNSSYNTGTHTVENEMTANSGSGPGAIYSDLRPIYNPRVARHFPLENDDVPTSLLDIDAGEELLDNYLPFGGSERLDLWESNLRLLKSICSGGTGVIFQYEHKERIGTFCPLHALSLDSSST